MDTHKHATIDFIMPDSQIGMIGIDFDLRINFWILGTIVRHRDEHGFLPRLNTFFERLVQVADSRGFLGRLVIPRPQH